MQASVLRIVLICVFVSVASIAAWSQSRRPRYPSQTTPPASRPSPPPVEDNAQPQDSQEVLKTDTNLVTVPVIALTSDGVYVPDLTKTDFGVEEDGVKQEISFFATVTQPFHVVLMLDTSASTREKLSLIRRAAIAFVDQLQPDDRVKVISFDDEVRDLNEFTGDRAVLRSAINRTAPGQGTKVYDAFELALNSIRKIQGRKAIVLFSDGVDWHSDDASFEGTLRSLEEEGVVVYPIRYETRADTERIARQQQEDIMPTLPTRDVINRPAPGTTAPTFPSDDTSTVPTTGRTNPTGPFGLPSAAEILRRRREAERERDERRDDGSYPRTDGPVSAERKYPGDAGTPRTSTRNPSPNDSITSMLDLAYQKADSYLIALADKSGGRLLRADTLASLPDAFAQIAAELRTQYAIGYYPTNKDRNGTYRKIKVSNSRKGVKLRARPGYRAPIGG
ncbi:MAG TPA: VWA domain-containing protein [Pyrinomonadaceae bacterium]|nr:VWA domain-containing protein [Pyrinomonadaceae bacterium]